MAFREEAAAWFARRNAVGLPLRVGMLHQNLRAFAHAEVFVEGLIKAGVKEKGLLLAREAGLAHCWRPSSGVGSLDAGERLGAGPGRIQAQRPYPVPGIRRLKRRHDVRLSRSTIHPASRPAQTGRTSRSPRCRSLLRGTSARRAERPERSSADVASTRIRPGPCAARPVRWSSR